MWWYDGGEMPPDDLRAQVGTRMPEQGSLVVGTDGLLVLPHGGEAFAAAGLEDGDDSEARTDAA